MTQGPSRPKSPTCATSWTGPSRTDFFDDATFDYSLAELGLKEDAVGGGIEIKQLRPLTTDQPWGVFFLNLPHKQLPQTIVRNILVA